MKEGSAKPLRGFELKLMACFFMFVDHFAKIVFPNHDFSVYLSGTIGRIAFPLFAFLLCEGFFHSKNRKKYALRLLILAVVSEPFYDMAFSGRWFWPGDQNVCFTLLLGLLACMAAFAFSDRMLKKTAVSAVYIKPLSMIAFIPFALAAFFFKADYSFWGIIVIAVFYFMHFTSAYIPGVVAGAVLGIAYGFYFSFAGAFILFFYGKKRGPYSTLIKYLFYVFYPAHIVILWLCTFI